MQGLLAVFSGLVVTLALSRRRVPLGAAFVVGALVLGLVSGLGPGPTAAAMGRLAVAPSTWSFAALVFLVFVLSAVLRSAGSLDILVQAAGSLIANRRLRLASLPALVGLLPMPGGAVVSAPLVERTGSDTELPCRDKNLINYWFRHVWEVAWPLYPAVLLAAGFAGLPVATFSATQLPLCLLLIAAGWLFVLRPVPAGDDTHRAAPPGRGKLVLALLPIAVVVAAMPLGGELTGAIGIGPRAGEAGLCFALLLGIGVAAARAGGLAMVLRGAIEKTTLTLVVLALGVKLFGGLVEESGAARATAECFRSGGLPPLLTVVLLPFVVGLATGNTVATVTVSFPVLVALLGPHGGETITPPLVLAYAAGFVGYMLSPVHMCLVLSSRYFGEAVSRAYRPLAAPLAFFAGGAALLYLVLRVATDVARVSP